MNAGIASWRWLVGTAAMVIAACGGSSSVVQSVPTGGVLLAVTFSDSGSGTVLLDASVGKCTLACDQRYPVGTKLTLTATADSGSVFGGWSGACQGNGTCELTLTADTAVNVSFQGTGSGTPNLTVAVLGQGSVTSAPTGINCGTSGSTCAANFSTGSTVVLSAVAASGYQFRGWTGACSGTGGSCSVTVSQALSVAASFTVTSTGQFSARPYLFKVAEARLRSSIAAGDPEATGSAENNAGTPVGFLTLARATLANRSSYNDVPTWQLAFAGWLLNDTAMMQMARNEAMAVVNGSPGGDSGTGDNFQHVEDRLFMVAATADLAIGQFSASQLAQVATWVNGTLDNWNSKNLSFWPFDEPRNNYWQNGFLAHTIGGIATEGFNSRAAEWRTKTASMASKFTNATTGANWSGPVQSEGHYYSAYVSHALWAMELYDGAMGTNLVGDSRLSIPSHLDLVMFQTRPHLLQFFEVGSEANNSLAPFTQNTIDYWYHLINSGQFTAQAQQAKTILTTALADNGNFWARNDKGFVNFYWNIRGVAGAPLSSKSDRMFVAPTPGAGLIGLRSSAGFQTNARAALMFANQFSSEPAYSHSNPDAPGFQWASGADWLVTDPEFYSNSGIIAEAGSGVYSDVSNIVTLAGQNKNEDGSFPLIRYAEDNSTAAVPHYYTSIDAQPYWTSASVYRREYVWLDDLQVVAIFDRIVGGSAKTWRLHVPAAVTINGANASYTINGKTVTVRNLQATSGGAWSSQNLNGSLTQRDVWRLTQADSASDYRSVKVLDVGGRVSAATLATGSGYQEAQITIGGATRRVRFFDDGTHATVN